MHKSVGAIIKNDKSEILMMERANFPLGWAGPAGHIDEGETPEQAMIREVKEETNLDIHKYRLLFHEFIEWNECGAGVKGHDWYLFEALDWSSDVKKDSREAKQMLWLASEKIKTLVLEEVWEYWFKKLAII